MKTFIDYLEMAREEDSKESKIIKVLNLLSCDGKGNIQDNTESERAANILGIETKDLQSYLKKNATPKILKDYMKSYDSYIDRKA